jgi:tetratricopeptide (TPR) repeat protein
VTVPFAIAGAMAAVLAARAPRARFAMLWIVVTLLPSMLVAIADISVTAAAERYLYLPSVGLALLVAIVLDAGRWDRAAASVMAAGLALTLLATATILRNRVWHDEIALWSDVTRQEQAFALPYLNLGLALADAGRLDEAGVAYQRGLEARATATVTRDLYVDLGHLELSRERLDEALAAFTRANAIAPHASAYYGIGVVYRTRARAALASGDESQALADFARARQALDAALRINWRHYKSQFMLASVLYQTRDLSGALEHYRKVVEIAPDTDLGADAAEAVQQLSAWLADPAHRAALSERAPTP